MLRILSDQAQIDEARESLRRADCDSRAGWPRLRFRLLYTLRYRRCPAPVDLLKSWDVWQMRQVVLQHLPDRQARLFDLGVFNSEIPLALWRSGYRRLRGADLDGRTRAMRWYGYGIDVRREDFYAPDLEPGTLDAITAVSTIEHGYDQERLLTTAHRLLRPGGLLLLTTDYHEEKIRTPEDVRLYGMTWQIFSRAEIEDLISAAERFGLEPLGDLAWAPSRHPIHFLGFEYTFVFLALRKKGA